MDREAFRERIAAYQGRLTIDIGTGDGLFIYNSARDNPDRFFIGIDANRSPLQKISEKIYRKTKRGGLPNVMYLQAAVESLPAELEGLADEVYVNFPWGSLLRGVVVGDETVLGNLRLISAPGAVLKLVLGIDFERDASEIERLGLPLFDDHYLSSTLPARYADTGFKIISVEPLSYVSAEELHTSWAKRLRASSTRKLIRIVATTIKKEDGRAGASPPSQPRAD